MNVQTKTFKISLIWVGCIFGILVGLTGCGGAPDWVSEGSGILNTEDEQVLYGVGSVVGVRNEPLAWETAENRARAELAKSVKAYTAYLMRDYVTSTGTGDILQSTEAQNIERAVKTLTTVTLRDVRPVGRYKDEERVAYYVLVKMSLKETQDMLEQADELDPPVRDFARDHGERVFKELEAEEAKRRVTP